MRERALILGVTRSNTRVIPYLQAFTTVAILIGLLGGFPAAWWGLSVLVYFLTGCLGVTMTYHRFLTHRSFRMWKPFEYLFSLFGALGGTGSSIGWTSVHPVHHRYSDRPGDPHSPIQHGWRVLFGSYASVFNKWTVRRLITDRFHRFLHEYYHAILVGWGIILALVGIEYLLFGFLIPMGLQIWISNLSNVFNHLTGYRNFDTPDNSRNTWWLAILAWGEGWHNNHHRHPRSATFQHRWWEIDLTYLISRIFGHSHRVGR